MRDDVRGALAVALISDVFIGVPDWPRLADRLARARALGAELAVLPEIPLGPWSPADRTARDDDAEPPGGPRQRCMSDAARTAGIGLVGGAIVRDPVDGERRNTALVYDPGGALVASYAKLHLPEEPGFWETSHYVPGDRPPAVVDGFGLRLGVQVCSDLNRPQGCHLLGAMGAEAILAPRATEQGTWDDWRLVIRANAMTSACWLLSVNRPRPELGVPLGGPSVAVAPDGEVVLETDDPVAVVRLDREAVTRARLAYPGYLPVRSGLYATAWAAVGDAHEEGPA